MIILTDKRAALINGQLYRWSGKNHRKALAWLLKPKGLPEYFKLAEGRNGK